MELRLIIKKSKYRMGNCQNKFKLIMELELVIIKPKYNVENYKRKSKLSMGFLDFIKPKYNMENPKYSWDYKTLSLKNVTWNYRRLLRNHKIKLKLCMGLGIFIRGFKYNMDIIKENLDKKWDWRLFIKKSEYNIENCGAKSKHIMELGCVIKKSKCNM